VEFYWNPIGAAGILAMTVSWTMAGLVYSTAPLRRQNRSLALFLLLQSIVHGIGQGLMYVIDDAQVVYALQVMSVSFAVAASAAYLAFLGTLPTGLTRPLRHRLVATTLVAASVVWFLAVVLQPKLFVTGVSPYPAYTRWDGDTTLPFTLAYVLGDGIAGLLGLVASVLMLRASRMGTMPRRKAVSYVVAFVVFDVFVALGLSLFNLLFIQGVPLEGLVPLVWVQNLGYIVFVFLMGYGILRAQLFDIDLKVKWTVKQSTVAALFVGVFFVVSESASTFLSGSGLGPYLGIAAAGLLVFAMAPLQRAADRVANAALPNADASRQYLEFRKLQVYQAALEGAYDDGLVTGKERTVLERLRAELAIAPEAAAAVEADLRRARAAHGAT
jgi:hypothetical protein